MTTALSPLNPSTSDPKGRAMPASELDQAYTHLCHTLTRIGPEQAELFLARLALLAMQNMADAKTAMAWVDEAADSLA